MDFDTTATTISIVSTSANDADAGPGIRTIFIAGLNSTYDEIQEVVTLTGLTPVVTTNTYLRINSCYNVTHGSLKGAAGEIIGTGNGFQWFRFLEGETNTWLGRYTVPRGHRLVCDSLAWSADKTGEYFILVYVKMPGLAEIQVIKYIIYQTSNFISGSPVTAVSEEKTDIIIKCRKLSGSGDLHLSANFTCILFNTQLMDSKISR